MKKVTYKLFSLICILVTALNVVNGQSITVNFENGITATTNKLSEGNYTMTINATGQSPRNFSLLKTVNSFVIQEASGPVVYSDYNVIWPTETSGAMGNKDELGPRRNSENFGQCVSRNMNNFCTDALSCSVLVLYPAEVLAACLIVCGLTTVNHGTITGGEIVSILNNTNNEIIYNN